MLTDPGIVFPGNGLIPTGQPQAGNVRNSGFHPASMFIRIRTPDFNFDMTRTRTSGCLDPGIASEFDWIDRVRNHCPAQTQVVLGNGIADAISRIVEGSLNSSGIQYRLLNGVDTQIDGVDPAR